MFDLEIYQIFYKKRSFLKKETTQIYNYKIQ